MTLAEFARLLDVNPKWVLNTMSALERPRNYSVSVARCLAVALAIHEGTGSPLTRSFATAERAVRAYPGDGSPVSIATDDADVELLVDVRRILSTFNVRLSVLRASFAPRQRGRPRVRLRDPLQAAAEWGIDLTLVSDNMRKTVGERVRQLDGMAAFAGKVHRLIPAET